MESLILLDPALPAGALLDSLRERHGEEVAEGLPEALRQDAAALAAQFRHSRQPSDGNRKTLLLTAEGTPPVTEPDGTPLRQLEAAADALSTTLAATLTAEFDRGARAVVVMTTHSPTLPLHLLDHAFRALLHHDVVIGPDFGGRCYLLGVQRPPPSLLGRLLWQPSPSVEELLAAVGRGTAVQLLPFWYRLDEPARLRWLETHLGVLDARDARCGLATLELLLGDAPPDPD